MGSGMVPLISGSLVQIQYGQVAIKSQHYLRALEMELVNTRTLQKNQTQNLDYLQNSHASQPVECSTGLSKTSQTRWSFTRAVWTCCRATGTCPSFKGHTFEPVTKGSAWTVTSGAPSTKDYTGLGSPRYSPAITALAWCSAGSRCAPGTPLLLTGLEEVGRALGSRSSLMPSHSPPASEERACFVLQGSRMLGDHAGG